MLKVCWKTHLFLKNGMKNLCMPKLIIIRGYCGTGKSSVAKRLARTMKCAFLEYDDFLWGFNAMQKPTPAIYKITYKNFMSVLKNYLDEKKDVIVEGPLVPRTNQDPFRIKEVIALAKRKKYTIKPIQLTATDEVCVIRMRKRSHVVPKKERRMFAKKHQESVQPNEYVLDTSKLTLDETFAKVSVFIAK